MTGYDPPTAIYGVDFSASSRDAGRKTWVAEGHVEGIGLRIEGLADAASAIDCNPDRGSTVEALAGEIERDSGESAAYGLDFPFGLPESLLDDGQDWRGFVAGLPNRWGALDDVDGPGALYEAARTHVQERGDGLRRATDEKHGGQEPTGFRIKTQTYYGISKLLAEIVADVSVPPMDDPDGRPLVLEAYPACTFAELDGAVRTGYKRDTRDAIDARRRNVAALSEAGVAFGRYADYALASEDALDAVAAAYATFRATRSEETLAVSGDEVGGNASSYRREGYIYSGAPETE